MKIYEVPLDGIDKGKLDGDVLKIGDTKGLVSSILVDNSFSENGITYFSLGYLRRIEESLAKPTKGILERFPLASMNDVNTNSRIDINKIELHTELFNAYKRYFEQTLDEFTGYSQEKCDGYVVGLSGGIDSAVVLRLIQYSGYPVVPIIMGHGDHNTDISEYNGTKAEWLDIQYAKNMCKDLGIPFEYVDLTSIINSFTTSLNSESWVNSGISPRVRSVVLYTFADANNLISAGTTNGTEYILAAFSVGGPAGHISPIIDLYKSEVYATAKKIGVPDYISDRKPLISELDIQDDSLYGVDCTIIDPVIRRLWFQKMTPEEVSKELGHSVEWIERIKRLRIDGEKCRRNPTPFLVNRQLEIKHSPTVIIDRSHFKF